MVISKKIESIRWVQFLNEAVCIDFALEKGMNPLLTVMFKMSI